MDLGQISPLNRYMGELFEPSSSGLYDHFMLLRDLSGYLEPTPSQLSPTPFTRKLNELIVSECLSHGLDAASDRFKLPRQTIQLLVTFNALP
jgi:hypothetical protein